MRVPLPKLSGSLLFFLSFPFFCTAQLSEKIHIQTDKTTYLEGETIWFKAYIFYGNKPSTLSTNFYVGLYDNEGKLITQKKFPIVDGTCTGEFIVPDSSGTYLRLGGKTINSASPEILALKIYKTGIVSGMPADKNIQDGISIFSENSSPAFSLNNHFLIQSSVNGKPAETAGALYNNSNQFVDSFFTDVNGFAAFQLTPNAGSWYYLQWKDKNGNIQKKDLPVFGDPGAVLHTEQGNGELHFSIQTATASPRLAKMHLLVVTGEDSLFTAAIALKNTLLVNGSVPLGKLGSGLVQVQLLDADKNLLQYRNILLPNENFIPVVAHTKKSFLPKGENTIRISSSKLSGYDLSLSISDIHFTKEFLVHSFADVLWQDYSEKNKLYNASLSGNNKLADRIIVSGNKAERLLAGKNKKDDYISLSIEPAVALAAGEKASVIITDKSGKKQFYTVDPGATNQFNLQDLIFYDSAKVYYTLAQHKELNDHLKVKSSNNSLLPANIEKLELLPSTDTTENIQEDVALVNTYQEKRPSKFNELQTIQSVIVKSKKVNTIAQRLNELEDRYATGMFRGTTKGFQLNVLDDPNAEMAADIFTYLGTRLGLFTRGGTIGSRRLEGLRGTPQLYIDEVQLLDENGQSLWDILEQYRPSHLAYVKYIPGVVINGAGYTESGVLYIYTRKGKDLDPKDVAGKGMASMKINGYDIYKEFQLPDYSDKKSLSDPDYRTTLYWNPYLNTEGKNAIEIKYFNNDIATKHLLVLKGFDEDGVPFEIRQVLE